MPRDSGDPEPLGLNGTPLPRFGLRLGDTATFRAQAEETYFGDSGCRPEGPLGPSSSADPEGFDWSTEDPIGLSVSPSGFVRGLELGETVLHVERKDPEVTGRAIIRVLPWFDSVSVEASRDTVAVGDTVTILITALSHQSAIVGVDFHTAGLGVVAEPATALVNSIYSVFDQSPIRVVMLAQTPGVVRLKAANSVVSFGSALGVDSIRVVPAAP